jgi:tetratricopeptide (TPR) repeat protein
MLTNRFAEVLPITDDVLLYAEHHDDLELLTDTLVTRGTALTNLLRWREGAAVFASAMETAKAEGLNATWLRALNNSLSISLALDPQDAMSQVRGGFTLAQRIGHEAWVQSLSGMLALVAWRTGDWDAVLPEVEKALSGATHARTRLIAVDNIATIKAFRGEPIDDHVAELRATAAESPDDENARSVLMDGEALWHLQAGRLREAFEAWSQLEQLDPTISGANASIIGRFAVWLGRLEDADRWATLHWDYVPHGGASEVDHLTLAAALKALRGDRAGAAVDYREAIRRYRELRLDLEIAYIAIDLAWTIGPDEPLTREIIPEARATFARERARTFLDFLDEALARGPHDLDGKVKKVRSSRETGVASA